MSVFTLTGYRYQTSLTTICQCSHLLVTDIKIDLQLTMFGYHERNRIMVAGFTSTEEMQ
jgi:hypothetical protein